MPYDDLVPLLDRLRKRGGPTRTEADIQADVRELLLHGDLDLDDEQVEVRLEAQAGGQRRIDVEVGFTVIETKKDLRKAGVLDAAVDQLADYVRRRNEDFQQRYVGILTDGAEWRLYTLLPDGTLAEVSTFELRSVDEGPRLVGWLSSVLATTRDVSATPVEVERRFGAQSPGFELDRAALRNLWVEHGSEPEMALKKELWGKLLHTAFGEQFKSEAEHFIEHTYLVITAELIAHALLGFDVTAVPAIDIVSGTRFEEADVFGVVESDFFDWPAHLKGGEQLVRAIARRVGQMNWSEARHDVLKHLYESVISPKQRHDLGEYYTPDWLAQAVVESVVDEPQSQRVLDPACGSGTFLFHAVKRVVAALSAQGRSNKDILDHVTKHVIGLDVHPVAVTLARVTYLLALGDRLKGDRGGLRIPVFLGDSVQWQVLDTLSQDGLTIYTDSGNYALLSSELYFPRAAMPTPERFDQLIRDLSRAATDRPRASRVPSIRAFIKDLGLSDLDRNAVEATFSALCDLHDNHRNHIWGYYIRNLARPLWLSDEGRVDRIVGNPPWLAYRFMDPTMKASFKERSKVRNLWVGGQVATQQDLAPYFLVRSCELYLRAGGRFGMVMPLATLSRKPSVGFRSGEWDVSGAAAYDDVWHLEDVKPPIFPVPSSVVMGTYLGHSGTAVPLIGATERWDGKVPPDASWDAVSASISRTPLTPVARGSSETWSPYHDGTFTQGANVVPRVLHVVETAAVTSGLGLPTGVVNVVSVRSSNEKAPWKTLPSRGPIAVETAFVRDMHLGSTLLPFRLTAPWKAVLPIDPVTGELIGDRPNQLSRHQRLKAWWSAGEATWESHRGEGTNSSLEDWVDWQGKLAAQLPAPPLRIIYTKSGARLTAAVLDDPTAIIDHTLYWGRLTSRAEGNFLAAILNARVSQRLVEPLQSRGNLGARHFDLYPWELPIPRFNPEDPAHADLAHLGSLAAVVAAEVDLPRGVGFQKARAIVREALARDGIASTLEIGVGRLLGVDEGP